MTNTLTAEPWRLVYPWLDGPMSGSAPPSYHTQPPSPPSPPGGDGDSGTGTNGPEDTLILLSSEDFSITGSLEAPTEGRSPKHLQAMLEPQSSSTGTTSTTEAATAVPPFPRIRGATYSFRLSGDVPLRTIRPDHTGHAGHADLADHVDHPPPDIRDTWAASGGRSTRQRVLSSWMSDDQSFWTARGTLRVPANDGEAEREVLVAYMPDGGDMEERIRQSMEPTFASEDSGRTVSAGGPTRPNGPTDPIGPTSATPLPLLLLFNQPHPPPSSTDRPSPSPPSRDDPSDTVSGSSTDRTAGSARYALVLGSHLLGSAQRQAEKAFWGVLMPSLSGLVEWGEALQGALVAVHSYLPSSAGSYDPDGRLDHSKDLLQRQGQGHQPRAHLYSDETVYTLRLPGPAWDREDKSGTERCQRAVDIGPTIRPEFVKKRGAIPAWEKDFVGMGGEWGRDVGKDVRGLWV